MAILSFDPKYRRTWMFPRNIRRIEPWKLDQILNLLLACQDNTGSQIVQDALYTELEKLNIKRERNSIKSKNAGGMRTYFSQLEILGLIVADPKTKLYEPTKAGFEMMNHREPMKVFRYQLCRLQYPSSYSYSQNLKIDPRIKIKPFVFLCKLLRDERLGGLSCKDMVIPILYGHSDDCYEECVTRILKLRNEKYDFTKVIFDKKDFYTVKAKNRNYDGGLKDVLDIANTAKNYLQAGNMILEDDDFADNKRYVLTSDFDALEILQNIGEEPIEQYDQISTENFQLRYGRYDSKKAVRPWGNKSALKNSGLNILVSTLFTARLSDTPYGVNVRQFVDEIKTGYGLSENDVYNIISPLIQRRNSIERQVVLDAAFSGGVQASLLEKAVTEIFKRLGFDQSQWIGSRKPKTRRGGYPDIYIRASSWNHCAMGDSKATNRYKFPIGDTQKLATYYNSCELELDTHCPSDFFIYIAGGFESENLVKKHLLLCRQNLGKPVSAITVGTLLDLVTLKQKPDLRTIIQKFSSGSFYTSVKQFETSVQ